jgi:hypothetical protein
MGCLAKNGLSLMIGVLLSLQAFANDDIDIRSIDFEVYKSFHVQNPRTSRQRVIAPKRNRVVKILGEKQGWAYVVRIFDNGKPVGGDYLVAKKWARKALNIQAALHAVRINDEVRNALQPPVAPCELAEEEIQRVRAEELAPTIVDEPPVVVDRGTWKPGCEVLSKGKSLTEGADTSSLLQCVRSIQLSITNGGRVSRRAILFRNMYKNLNPEEQRFAAMIFTAQGEASILANQSTPHLNELMVVMKTLENRKNDSNANRNRRARRKAPFNELDVALDHMQYSMYNANDSNWKRVLLRESGRDFSNAVTAFIQYQTANFQPKPEVEDVRHYHANYSNPNWLVRSKRVNMSVNGNEATGKGNVRHIFYQDIVWSRSPRIDWRS